jgi:hypothetical protein
MDMNVISPVELYTALTANGGIGNTVATLFELDQTSIDVFIQRYQRAFDYCSKIKWCIEILFSRNLLAIYAYSGITPCTVDLHIPFNPVGELS